MTANGSPFSSLDKENDSFSDMFGNSLQMTPQQAEKQRASEARAKVLKERAQQAEELHVEGGNRRRSGGLFTEEQIRKSVEKERRKSRDRIETRLSLSPSKKFDPSNETSWSQMLKWIPYNAPNTSTFLDRDGYAVPNTLGPFTNSGLKTPERVKSPEELFFTPAARISGRFSSPYRNLSGEEDSLAGRFGDDFSKKLSLEATKIGLMTRKTIQGLDEVGKMIDEADEKTWRSPLKKCSLKIPEFSGLRQSHPLTKDNSEFRSSLPGAVGRLSDDETTLDNVSPLNSEAAPTPKRPSTVTTKTVSSKLPKILGAQLQTEINYTQLSQNLDKKLEDIEELLNSTKTLEAEDSNLSAMLDDIQLFDHSLPQFSLTPKNRYRRVSQIAKEEASSSPGSSGRRKAVSFLEVDRSQLLSDFCKILMECAETLKRYVGQQEKIHQKVDEHGLHDDCFQRVIQSFYEDFKMQLQEKKKEVKEKSEDRRISEGEFVAWMKQEKKKIENQSKFFALVWLDQGKFIRKYDIQPPQPVYVSSKMSTVAALTAPPNTLSAGSQQSQVDSSWKSVADVRQAKKKDEWEVSVRESLASSPLDQAFVGGLNSTPQMEKENDDIWDESLKEPETGNSFASLLDSPEVSNESVGSLPREESVSDNSTPYSPEKEQNVLAVNDAEVEKIATVLVEVVSERTDQGSSLSSSSSTIQLSEEESAEPRSAEPLRYPRSPRGHPAVPPLELSLLHSSGRVSIDASGLFEDEEVIDDFLNRSGRKEPPQRYKLDVSLLNDTAPADESAPERSSPKKEFVNEPYPKTSPQLEASTNADPSKNRPPSAAIDFNLSEEEEGLEDVKKPEPMLDFTISKAVTEYEKKMVSEEEKWDAFVGFIQNPEKRIEMMEECVEIVWKVKEEYGYLPRDKQSNWEQFVEEYKAVERFENKERQQMYASEWIGMLGDVFEIASDLFPQEQRRNYKLPFYPLSLSYLDKNKFTKICREHLLEKKRGHFVEQTTKEYQWDLDPARRNANEMVYEEHHVYLKQELCEAIEDGVKRGVFETADLYLQRTVDSLIEEGKRSLEKY